MIKPGENTSTLFRSLRPDNANFQASSNEAAREAEQRWPLFKAVSPRKADPTPALSAQERLHWGSQERPGFQERKPALSLPDFGNKLASGLSKMSGRRPPVTAPSPAMRAEREQSFSEPVRSVAQPLPEASIEARRPLFSRTSAIDQGDVVPGYRSGLSETKLAQPVAAEPESRGTAHSDDSLSNIFNRLGGKEKVVEKPVGRRSSFLGRLGKR